VLALQAVQDGEFGAMMEVSIVNDGPVTIILDSVQRDPADVAAGGGAGGQRVVHGTGQAKSKAREQVKGKVKVIGAGEGGERAEQQP
jgi:hypothetical protein